MLRKLTAIVIAFSLALVINWLEAGLALADCSVNGPITAKLDKGSVTVGVSCQDAASSKAAAGSNTLNGDGGCRHSDGTEVPCWVGQMWWNSSLDKYCRVWNLPADNSLWDAHRDARGNPVGTYYMCNYLFSDAADSPFWDDSPPVTPPVPGVDPEATVRSAVASIGLHAPKTGVGAYVYPGYQQWGLSWWVGAPMWLWVDASDPLQWGTHTITASQDGVSVSATVTAKKVQYDPGDGSGLVTCGGAGTKRAWNPNDLLEKHSPSRCEHTYLHTNTLGDVNSRYTVTATVVWDVIWSASNGQHGVFTTTMTSSEPASIHVGELRVVRVPDPDK